MGVKLIENQRLLPERKKLNFVLGEHQFQIYEFKGIDLHFAYPARPPVGLSRT
jgi:hypothetical protein